VTPGAWRIVFAAIGLLCLGLALNDLRRGSTRIAGMAFGRAQHPVAYWGMILLTAIVAASLLAGSVAEGHG
jgi:hypothetical protein